MPCTQRRSLVLASWMFAALNLSTASLVAQDDIDLSVDRGARALDFDIDDQGTIVLAWAEPKSPYDQIHVLRSDDQGRSWIPLYVGPLGRVEEIRHLSLDLAYGTGNSSIDRKVYIGVNGVWSDRGQPLGFLGMLSGSYLQPWPGPQCVWIEPSWGHARPWSEMHSSIAVIPLAGGSDYAVGMAFTFPSLKSGTSTVQVTYSEDYGKSCQYGRIVAGPYGDVISSGSNFGHPSLVGDLNTRETVLVFHDDTDGVVHLVSGRSEDHIQRWKSLKATFQTSPSVRTHHPEVAVYRGEINFTALRGQPDRYGAYSLTWYNGITAGSFTELPALHGRAQTSADIEIRGNDAFITAVCVTDPVLPNPGIGVLFFQAHVRGFEVTTTQINDHPLVRPATPRMAITPRGANAIPAESQLYRTSSPTGDIWIDP